MLGPNTANDVSFLRRVVADIDAKELTRLRDVAASVLASRGFTDVSDVLGGFEAWRAETADAA